MFTAVVHNKHTNIKTRKTLIFGVCFYAGETLPKVQYVWNPQLSEFSVICGLVYDRL